LYLIGQRGNTERGFEIERQNLTLCTLTLNLCLVHVTVKYNPEQCFKSVHISGVNGSVAREVHMAETM
jgi:hypothetical protein